MENKTWTGILGGLCIFLLVFSVIGFTTRTSDSKVLSMVDDAEDAVKEKLESEFAISLEEIKDLHDSQLVVLNDKITGLETDKSALDSENSDLQTEIDGLELEVIDEDDTTKYILEDVSLVDGFVKELDSDDLDALLFGDVDYEGNDYDFEEKLFISEDFRPILNVDDSNGDVKIGIFDEGAIKYVLEFDEKIVIKDEDLEIVFLGKPLNIVSYDGTNLEYRVSTNFAGKIGDEFTYEDYVIKILAVDADDNEVQFSVNDEIKSVEEDKERSIDNLDVFVENVFVSDINAYSLVEFYVGEDITEVISTGDEVEFDEDYAWIIDGDVDGLESIGIELIETLADDDEVMSVGDIISLPNDYITFTFEKVKNMELYNVELRVSNTKLKVSFEDVIEIDGDKIDDAEFVVDLDATPLAFSYEYKGDDKEGTDFSLISFFADDREFGFGMTEDTIRVGLNDETGYRFNYADGDFIASFDGAEDMNEDEDFRMDNGDLLYKSDVNEEDGDSNVKVGLVSDDVEVILSIK